MYISADLLENLFLRLPLKSLGRFKTISKEWKAILESKMFVDMHLSLENSKKILTADHCNCDVPPHLLHPMTQFLWGERFLSLHCVATKPSLSCDGLVCIPETEHVNVLNPSTGQLWRFSSPLLLNFRPNDRFTNGTWSTYFPGYCAMGFGRDSVKGSYKVVRILDKPNYCDILDVQTGQWKRLRKPRRYKVDLGRKSACANGAIYWLRIVQRGGGDELPYSILALDLHKEEFHQVQRPPLPKGITFEAQVVNIGDRLCIAMPQSSTVNGWELEIWSMDAQTWSKTHSISLASLNMKPQESISFTPVTLSKQGNVVFYDHKKRLFKYYQKENQLQILSLDICVISSYVENLVPISTKQVELTTGITCLHGATDVTYSEIDLSKDIELCINWLRNNRFISAAIIWISSIGYWDIIKTMFIIFVFQLVMSMPSVLSVAVLSSALTVILMFMAIEALTRRLLHLLALPFQYLIGNAFTILDSR